MIALVRDGAIGRETEVAVCIYLGSRQHLLLLSMVGVNQNLSLLSWSQISRTITAARDTVE